MIIVNSISKSYGNIVSLNDISFNIRKGEIFGLLGPNGAGKSTIVNILNTILKPDSGEIFIDGVNLKLNPDSCKMIMGIVPQEIALYENLSAYENLLFWGGLYNVPRSVLKKIAIEILGLIGLSSRKDDSIKTFSGGMKRRINIACSLLHKPRILVMDEPTIGVDPQNRNHIFKIIENLNSEGITIIYTTHYMDEAERLCDRIAIIDNGIIKAQGTLQELRNISRSREIVTIKLKFLSDQIVNYISNKMSFPVIDRVLNIIKVECKDVGSEISDILKHLHSAGAEIKSIDTQDADLESIFLKLTGKKLRD
jgi:ABC-2 type transport system ATP-binding protein